jgi:hypothetical protein
METTETFGKEQWVAMFAELGLGREAMHRWHATFEARHPAPPGGAWLWASMGLEVLSVYLERNLAVVHRTAEVHADMLGAG